MLVKKAKLTPQEAADLEYGAACAAQNSSDITDVTSALVELAELFAEQDDALVELAELIGG